MDESRWHVAWSTHLAWPPVDERGDWHELSELYARVAAAGGSVVTSAALPDRWHGQPPRAGHVELSAAARRKVSDDLVDLAKSDRVAGGTTISAVAVGPLWVQVVLACPAGQFHQRVGRLKSRSATLLGFDKKLGVGGAVTWGSGFWWASLRDEIAVRMAAGFVLAAGRNELPDDQPRP